MSNSPSSPQFLYDAMVRSAPERRDEIITTLQHFRKHPGLPHEQVRVYSFPPQIELLKNIWRLLLWSSRPNDIPLHHHHHHKVKNHLFSSLGDDFVQDCWKAARRDLRNEAAQLQSGEPSDPFVYAYLCAHPSLLVL